ncbi:MAG TPA: hypothetical protein VNE42_06755 [Acidimicrobiales bacterium]|nr:hypothetical protein [Acidimicrobiales bacterium]
MKADASATRLFEMTPHIAQKVRRSEAVDLFAIGAEETLLSYSKAPFPWRYLTASTENR